jgi:hypothetical protein
MQARLRGDRVETARLILSLGPDPDLDQDEKPGKPGDEAGVGPLLMDRPSIRLGTSAAHKATAMTIVLAITAQVAGLTLDANARDRGQYNDVPENIREWFRALRNPQTGVNCCDLSDCARTEARTHGNEWEARAPNGLWIPVPDDKVVHNQGNPTGEPILCAAEYEEGWRVLCFVPGPGG